MTIPKKAKLVCTLLAISIASAGCMVSELKPDKEIKGHSAQNTFVNIPNTLRFDGFVVPAGKYYPFKQSESSVYYRSNKLLTTHGFTVPKANRDGGVAIREEAGVLTPRIWYWEGGYSPGPELAGKNLSLYQFNRKSSSASLLHDFSSEQQATNKHCNDGKPSIRLVIEEVGQNPYSPDFNSMVYQGFEQSGLFCNMYGESEASKNTVIVLLQGKYDQSKQSDANMWATALTAGVVPFKHHWNYSLNIKVVTPHGNEEYFYSGDSSGYVNIAKDMDDVHSASIHALLDKFFEKIQEDGSYHSMTGIKL